MMSYQTSHRVSQSRFLSPDGLLHQMSPCRYGALELHCT